MKIYNNISITYSAIEQNSRKNTKQNIPADLEKDVYKRQLLWCVRCQYGASDNYFYESSG